ncbi:MAG: hypothetical protein ACRDQZ_10645 [Mycobacteriales bacterium]
MPWIIGKFILGERTTHVKTCAVAIALLGLGCYAAPVLDFDRGVLAAMAAGVCEGAANALRKNLGGADRSAILTVQYGVGSLLALVAAFVTGEHFVHAEKPGVSGIVWPPLVAVVTASA